MNRLKLITICAALLCAASLAAVAASARTQARRGRASAAERGRAVYADRCARCHGADGTGNTRMGEMTEAPNLADPAWRRGKSSARMVASVTDGRGQMPAFKNKLSRQEIAAAVAYVRTLGR